MSNGSSWHSGNCLNSEVSQSKYALDFPLRFVPLCLPITGIFVLLIYAIFRYFTFFDAFIFTTICGSIKVLLFLILFLGGKFMQRNSLESFLLPALDICEKLHSGK